MRKVRLRYEESNNELLVARKISLSKPGNHWVQNLPSQMRGLGCREEKQVPERHILIHNQGEIPVYCIKISEPPRKILCLLLEREQPVLHGSQLLITGPWLWKLDNASQIAIRRFIELSAG